MSKPFRSLKSTNSEVVTIMKLKVRELMMQVASEPFVLCEVVAGGELLWRNACHAAFRGYPITDDIADRMFAFFCGAVQALFGANGTEAFKSEELEAAAIAGDFLDSCSPLPGAPTREEVMKGWTIEDASSEEAKRQEYGGLHPSEWLERQVKIDADADPA